jgi:catechol 2,3-dioxygenase-like lactoylglutathione lyase family enzyme
MAGSEGRARGIDHVGVTVRDLDEASQFLEDALGAEVMYDLFGPSVDPALPGVALNGFDGPTDERLDFSGANINDASPPLGFLGHRMMRLGDGATLELLLLDGGDPVASDYGHLGVSHFSVFVDDIDAAARRVQAAGGALYDRFEMIGLEAGERAEAQYALAPFGLRFELISYGHLAYERVTPLRRTWALRGDVRKDTRPATD